MSKDFVSKQGAGAFGTRLRRLSERLDRSVAAAYAEQGVTFEPRWYPVVRLLDNEGAMGVMDIASAIGVSHAAVSQVAGPLVAQGICSQAADASDGRKRMLALTPKGKRTVKKLEPLWCAIQQATEELLQSNAPTFLKQLDRLDAALDETDLSGRIHAQLETEPIN